MRLVVEPLESFFPGQQSLVDALGANVLLLVTFVLPPDGDLGIIVLPPLIIQRGQLSFEFLMFCTCVTLRSHQQPVISRFASNAPARRQAALGPRSREVTPELP